MTDVLVLTGGLVGTKEESITRLLYKQMLQWKNAEAAWLELKIKANVAEPVLYGELEKKKYLNKNSPQPELSSFLVSEVNSSPPSLTEVVLMTALAKENLSYQAMTIDEIFSKPKKFKKNLAEARVVFLSSTFLRDLSELNTILSFVKHPHIVVGGALAGTLHGEWAGDVRVEVLAIGYGELLVPALAEWIRSDFKNLKSPPGGRIVRKELTQFLYSGVPNSLNLDFLPVPDWELANQAHNKKFDMIFYESVRGCPYRCSFCNYPYLFDDTKFRTKSAKKMAEDWEHYEKTLGVKYITCLDSLFTMPKKRLIDFCEELIRRKLTIKWICYARADDLCDLEVVSLLKRAGCIQVQIGTESGDPGQLQRMNKKVDVETNGLALDNCKKLGLTTVISLIVGYPGETAESMKNTFQFLKNHPPDFYFLATFSVRVPGVPVLTSPLKEEFGLEVRSSLFTVSPYWKHNTMDCVEVGNWVRWLNDKLMSERVALDATLFFSSLVNFKPQFRESLLDLQERANKNHPLIRKGFDKFHAWIDRRLERDFEVWSPRAKTSTSGAPPKPFVPVPSPQRF